MSLPARRNPQPAEQVDPAAEAIAFAVNAARIAAELRTEDVTVLDLRGLSTLADVFVLGTGTSDRQMRAVLDRLERHARSLGRKPLCPPDRRSTTWVLADYVDVVIHLFDPEHRDYYDLDGLWGDAPRIDWEPPGADASEANDKD